MLSLICRELNLTHEQIHLLGEYLGVTIAVEVKEKVDTNEITIQIEDVGYLMPQIQPLVILLTMCVGYFVFKEKISYYQIIGGVLIVGGVYFLNKKKK